MSEPDGFREFVAVRSPALLRTAWMLTGDVQLAEDLLQTALHAPGRTGRGCGTSGRRRMCAA
jgi:hypothetical protein